MISLKFLDGVLHQSIQMQPGGQWTDYHPVPSETIPKEKSLEEKLAETSIVRGDAHCPGLSPMDKAKILADICREHFKQQRTLNSNITGEVA